MTQDQKPSYPSVKDTPAAKMERQRKVAQQRIAKRFAQYEETERRGLSKGPTKQTKKKFRKSLVTYLFNRRKIGMAELQAAYEIEYCWTAKTAQLYVKSQNFEATGNSHPKPTWPPYLTHCVKGRFDPWTRILRDRHKLLGSPEFDVCISVICEGENSDTLARLYRCRNKTIQDWLIEGLKTYAEIAGWEL